MREPSSSLGRDILLCAWIALVAVSFWGPYLGLALPANILNALYAVFLVVVIAAVALRLVKGGVTEANSREQPVEGGSRRGR